MHLPVIIGFGGINAAGRSSFSHALRRMLFDALPQAEQSRTIEEFFTLMNLGTVVRDAGCLHFVAHTGEKHKSDEMMSRFKEYVLDHTLIRPIESQYFFPRKITRNKQATLHGLLDSDLEVRIAKSSLPDNRPGAWHVNSISAQHSSIHAEQGLDVLLPDSRELDVLVAGMLPTGFDPAALYPARNHPRGLQLALFSASDALNASGIDWPQVQSIVPPDRIAVFATSALGQLDEYGMGGMLTAGSLGDRVTAKQLPLSYTQMVADFVNAYVLGSAGRTGSSVGACASFLYNLDSAVQAIKNGLIDIAVVGSSEAPILPQVIEGFDVMGALANGDETQAILSRYGLSKEEALRRSSRPFCDNNGFVIGESAQFFIIASDKLALEIGGEIYGSVPYVFTSADGFKKSIASPGVGNYITMAKAVAAAQSIVGSETMRHKSYVYAHGTSTPQNRVTESSILNKVAQAFGIESWAIAAIKCYLGHSQASSSGDQLSCACSSWQQGKIPGISTLDAVAPDVVADHLDISAGHKENDKDVAIINSKGFGGNNASAALLSPRVTLDLIASKHGKRLSSAQIKAKDSTEKNSQRYYEEIQNGVLPIRYHFGHKVLSDENVAITDKKVSLEGFPDIPLDKFNDF